MKEGHWQENRPRDLPQSAASDPLASQMALLPYATRKSHSNQRSYGSTDHAKGDDKIRGEDGLCAYGILLGEAVSCCPCWIWKYPVYILEISDGRSGAPFTVTDFTGCNRPPPVNGVGRDIKKMARAAGNRQPGSADGKIMPPYANAPCLQYAERVGRRLPAQSPWDSDFEHSSF